MNKLTKGLAIAGLALATFSATSISASAHRRYTEIPKSLRGTWYAENDKDDSKLDKVSFSKYRYYWKGAFDKHGYSISGKHYSSGEPHSDLTVSHRTKKGYYVVGQYASDEWPYWKRSRSYLYDQKGKKHYYTALKCVAPLPDEYGNHDVTYYFKLKSWY